MTTSKTITKHYLIVKHISEATINFEGEPTQVYVIGFTSTEVVGDALSYVTFDANALEQFPVGAKVENTFKVTPA